MLLSQLSRHKTHTHLALWAAALTHTHTHPSRDSLHSCGRTRRRKTNLVPLKKHNPCHLIHLTARISPQSQARTKPAKIGENRLAGFAAYQRATCLILACLFRTWAPQLPPGLAFKGSHPIEIILSTLWSRHLKPVRLICPATVYCG